MHVDSLVLAALSDELNASLAGGRVQDVILVSDLAFGLEVYANRQRRYLLISAEPKDARCHLASAKFRRGVERPTGFALLVRKHVEGARLVAVSQPAWERALYFDFSGVEGDVRLIAEIMERRSNLMLTVESEILDAARRVPPQESRRAVLPRHPYVPLPPPNKITPEQVGESGMTAILRGDPDARAWRALVDSIAGVSPLFAREIVFRAFGDAEALAFDVSPRIVYQAFAALRDDALARRWSPCLVPAESGDGFRAFAAYPLTLFGSVQPASSMSAALEAYFAAPAAARDPYQRGKQTVGRQVASASDRVRRKLAALERELEKSAEIETLRKQGELILAYASTLKPRQTELVAQYDADSPPLTVLLDPDLNPSRNARRYFDRYEKVKRAVAGVPARIAVARREAEHIAQIAVDLDLAESWPEIDAAREELQKAGYWQGSKALGPKSGRLGVRRVTTPAGFVILVGRNAEQNHALVTAKSKPDDLWLHARDVAGSHVIVRADGRPIPEEVVELAARLAARYSAARSESAVEVVVTERRHVRPIKGGRPGQVTFKRERVIRVIPANFAERN